MSTTRTIDRVVIITLFCFLAGLSCSTKSPEVIRTGFVPSASGASAFHALESGCIKEFEIVSDKYRSSDLLATDLRRNQVQVALVCGIAEMLSQASIEGGSVSIIAVFESTPCFIVPKGVPEDFVSYVKEKSRKREKTVIGCWPGVTFPYYTRLVLDSLGLAKEDIYISPIAPDLQISEIEKGQVDALFTLEPIGVKAFVDGSAEYRFRNVNLLAKYVSRGDYFPGGCLAISKNARETKQKLVENLLECISKAGTEVSSSNPTTIQALARYTALLPNYTASLNLNKPITGQEMRGVEMANLVSSLIEMKQLPSGFDWRSALN